MSAAAASSEQLSERVVVSDGLDSGPISYEVEEALAKRRKDLNSKFTKASGKLKVMLEKGLQATSSSNAGAESIKLLEELQAHMSQQQADEKQRQVIRIK